MSVSLYEKNPNLIKLNTNDIENEETRYIDKLREFK